MATLAGRHDHELLVLSRPPDDVPDADYDRWYATHVRELLRLPAFLAAERMTLEFVSATTDPESVSTSTSKAS